MPVFVVSLPLVNVVAEDGGAAPELGHLPTQDHGVAITVQEGDPIRVGRDGCRRHSGKVTRVPVPQPEPPTATSPPREAPQPRTLLPPVLPPCPVSAASFKENGFIKGFPGETCGKEPTVHAGGLRNMGNSLSYVFTAISKHTFQYIHRSSNISIIQGPRIISVWPGHVK